jgi:hypothetical protein
MNIPLKQIGEWYFDTGWIIMSFLSVPAAIFATRCRKPIWALLAWCAGTLVLGLLMLKLKYL